MRKTKKYLRVRFFTASEDYRPVNWPPCGPYWCSGEGDGYFTMVAYVPTLRALLTDWPEATNIDVLEEDVAIEWSSRFARPGWWDAKMEAKYK